MKTLALAGLIFLSGCSLFGDDTFTLDQEIAIACRGYAGTLNVLAPLKVEMTAGQVAIVDQTNDIVIPACEDVLTGNVDPTNAALDAIRNGLSRVLAVESNLTGEPS